MNIQKFCIETLTELQQHKRNKEDLILLYVNNRLETSLVNYYSDLQDSINYLERRRELNLMKKMNRTFK